MATCNLDGQELSSRQPPQCQAPRALGSCQPAKENMTVDIPTHHTKFGGSCEGNKYHEKPHCQEALRSFPPGTQPIYVMDNAASPCSPNILTTDSQQVELPGKIQAWTTSPCLSLTSKVTDRETTKSGSRKNNANLEEKSRPVNSVPTKTGLLSGHTPLEPPYFVGQNFLTHQKEACWPQVTSDKNDPAPYFWVPKTCSLDASKRSVSMERSKGTTVKSQFEDSTSYCSPRDEGFTVYSYESSATGDTFNIAEVPRKNAQSLQSAPLFRNELATTTVSSSMTPTQSSMQNKCLPTHVGMLRTPLSSEKYIHEKDRVCQDETSTSANTKTSWDKPSSDSYRKASDKTLSVGTSCYSGVTYKTLPMTQRVDKGYNYTKCSLPESSENRAMTNHYELFQGPSELVSNADFRERAPAQMTCSHTSDLYKSLAAVVIDTGTGYSKCGLAGEDRTRAVVPTRVGKRPNHILDETPYYITEDIEAACNTLIRGVVTDWDALEVLWNHIFYSKLCVAPEELAVLVADSPVSPCTNREKVVELLFEVFEVPAMQTVHQALLTLYAYGRTTGLVMGSGHGTSYVAPIVTGELEPLNIYRLDVAGKDLSEYLSQLLLAGGKPSPKIDVLTHMKETCCYVTLDMVSELCQIDGKYRLDFVLPDKHVISLGPERFHCPEILFKPAILGLDQPSLPQLAQISISQLEPHLQEQLLANVVLEGGTTLLNGFSERVQQDLGPTATVLSFPHRAMAAWLGGSIMASLDSFQNLWLSRREYQEEGPWAIYKYHL